MNAPYLNRYRNGEYLQFMTDFLGLLSQQDLEALQLATQKADLDVAVKEISGVFKQSQGSGLTQEIIALDERRDSAIVGLRGVTDSYKSHFDKNIVDAATALNASITSHGSTIQRLSYQEETAVINSIVQDWENDAKLKAAIATLGIADWLAELKESNSLFAAKYLERVGETAQNPSANISELREKATETYRTLTTHIQAHATLTGKPEYATVLSQMDVLATQYNQVVENRAGNNSGESLQGEE